jgi:hypothetical protein
LRGAVEGGSVLSPSSSSLDVESEYEPEDGVTERDDAADEFELDDEVVVLRILCSDEMLDFELKFCPFVRPMFLSSELGFIRLLLVVVSFFEL